MVASIILHLICKIAGPQQLWAEPTSEGTPKQPGWAWGLLWDFGGVCEHMDPARGP